MAAMLADPNMRMNAGAVYLAFGDGTIGGAIDTAVANARVLRIEGAATRENAGTNRAP